MYDYNIFFSPTRSVLPNWVVCSSGCYEHDRPYAHMQFLLSQYILISLGDVSRNRAAGFHKHVSTLRSLCSVF